MINNEKAKQELLPIEKQFIELKLLRHNKFSDVFLCRHIFTLEDVMIEKFSYSFPLKAGLSSYISSQTMNRKILSSISTMHHTFDVFRNSTSTWYISENIEGDTVDVFINCEVLPISQAKYLFFLFVQTVQILHNHLLAVNDWRPKNFYMSSTMIKFMNYSELTPFTEVSNEKGLVYLTDPRWMAPEAFLSKRYTLPEADIWCLGLYLHYMLTGQLLFKDAKTMKRELKNFKYKPPRDMDVVASDLLSSILVLDPKKRLAIREILSHKFLMPTVPFPINRIPIEISNEITKWLNFFDLDHDTIIEKMKSYVCDDSVLLYNLIIRAVQKGRTLANIQQSKELNLNEILVKYATFPEEIQIDKFLFSDQKKNVNSSPRSPSSFVISLPYSSASRSPISTVRPSHASILTQHQSSQSIQNFEAKKDEKFNSCNVSIDDEKRKKKSQNLSKLLSICSNGLSNKGIQVEHLQSFVRNAQGFPSQIFKK